MQFVILELFSDVPLVGRAHYVISVSLSLVVNMVHVMELHGRVFVNPDGLECCVTKVMP